MIERFLRWWHGVDTRHEMTLAQIRVATEQVRASVEALQARVPR